MKGEADYLEDTLRGVVKAIRALMGNDIELFREVLSTTEKRGSGLPVDDDEVFFYPLPASLPVAVRWAERPPVHRTKSFLR